MVEEVTLEDILEAQKLIAGKVKRTHLDYSSTLSRLMDCSVYLKYESMQRAGSFKIRGAYNKIAHIPEDKRRKGVVAVSTGNHAQGVAYSASMFGIPSTIVMPTGAPLPKVQGTREYCGKVVLHGDSFEDAFKKAKEIQEKEGLTLVHAYDDPFVLAGAGTVGLEILEDLPDVDLVICPIGGGGLISGVSTAIKGRKPDTRIIGVQAKEMDAAHRSFKEGKLVKGMKAYTIANGLAIKSPSELTFSIIKKMVDDVVTVAEEEIAEAILFLIEKSKSVVEGAGAVALAALFNGGLARKGENVVLVLSGGNIDITMLGKIITQGLIKAGRYVEVEIEIEDGVGKLNSVLKTIKDVEANVTSINVDRYSPRLKFGNVLVELALETKGRKHSEEVMRTIKEHHDVLSFH
jgi:threonine dehydratase